MYLSRHNFLQTRQIFFALLTVLMGGCGFKPLHCHDNTSSVKLILSERSTYPLVEKEFLKHFTPTIDAQYHILLSITTSSMQTVISQEKTTSRLLQTYRFAYKIINTQTDKILSDTVIERSVPVTISEQSDISAFGTYTALSQQHSSVLSEMTAELADRFYGVLHGSV